MKNIDIGTDDNEIISGPYPPHPSISAWLWRLHIELFKDRGVMELVKEKRFDFNENPKKQENK